MRHYRKAASIFALLIIMIAGVCQTHACPACYGDPQSSQTAGLNMAILSLLGVTGGVLTAAGAFFLFLRRRLRLFNERFADKLN